MKSIKKTYRLMLLLAIPLAPCIVCIYSASLVKTGERPRNASAISTEMKQMIRHDAESMRTVYGAIRYSMKQTGRLLHFGEHNDLDRGRANCVGYAQVGAEICNRAFRAAGIDAEARPVVGYISLCGVNVCWVMKNVVPQEYSSFVKDHDFVEITTGGKKIYVDPSAYDYLGTTWETIKR
jgi:hypothetical protein